MYEVWQGIEYKLSEKNEVGYRWPGGGRSIGSKRPSILLKDRNSCHDIIVHITDWTSSHILFFRSLNIRVGIKTWSSNSFLLQLV